MGLMATQDPQVRAQRFPQLDGMRWDGRGGHVESYFLKVNDPGHPGRALWVKYTILSPTDRPDQAVAEVWGIRFDQGNNTGGKMTVPAAACELSRERAAVVIGSGRLEFSGPKGTGTCCGSVRAGTAELRWDLSFRTQGPAMYVFAHPWMYTGGFPKNKIYTPAPYLQMHGTLTLGDETWELDGWPGAFGHNWGPAHNPQYHWAQCNLFAGDEPAVFEAFSGKISIGPVLSPWLTGARLRFRGREWPFDALQRLWRPKVDVDVGTWSFQASQGDNRMTWTVTGERGDFVALQYLNPDGGLRHCLNTKIADCELLLESRERGQWCEVALLRSDRGCAYEILTTDVDHGINVLA